MEILNGVASILIWISAIVFIVDVYGTFSRVRKIEDKMEETERELKEKIEEVRKDIKDLIRISNFQN